jgi:hypothetical protein
MPFFKLHAHTKIASDRMSESESQRRRIFIAQMKEVFPAVTNNLYKCEGPLNDLDHFIEIRERLQIDDFYNYLLTMVGYFQQNSARFLDIDNLDDGLARKGINVDWEVIENDKPLDDFKDVLAIDHYDSDNNYVFSSFLYRDSLGSRLELHAPDEDDCVSMVFSGDKFDVKPVTIVE